MAKKQKKSPFPQNQYGFIGEEGTENEYVTLRDEMEDVVDEMDTGESMRVAIYKLDKVVTVTKVNDYVVK